MPTKSKSQITTNLGKSSPTRNSPGGRPPLNRPPTHPGEMLLEEFIRPLGFTQTQFAARLGVSYPRLNEIIRARRAVSTDTALRLQQVLGMPADFWLGLQLDWDLRHAKRDPSVADIERLVPIDPRQ